MIDLLYRNEQFWDEQCYKVERNPTNLFNFAFICSDSGTIELNGTVNGLKAGTIFHLAPGDHLKLSTSEADSLKYFSVQFYDVFTLVRRSTGMKAAAGR
jgi:hypothetical protein